MQWAFYHPTGPALLRQKRKGARAARGSDVGQERIGLRSVSIGAALQAQQGARSGGGVCPEHRSVRTAVVCAIGSGDEGGDTMYEQNVL